MKIDEILGGLVPSNFNWKNVRFGRFRAGWEKTYPNEEGFNLHQLITTGTNSYQLVPTGTKSFSQILGPLYTSFPNPTSTNTEQRTSNHEPQTTNHEPRTDKKRNKSDWD